MREHRKLHKIEKIRPQAYWVSLNGKKTGAVLQLYQPEETLNNISTFYSTIFVYHLSALKVL